MKKSELQELIRYVTRRVLKEYTTLSSTDKKDTQFGKDLSVDSAPEDVLSPAEQAKIRREKLHARDIALKNKEQELKTAKKEMEFQKQKVDQSKRFTIPNATKAIQALKGAKI